MTWAIIAIIIGFIGLIWSADQFVNGSAAIAKHFGMPPMLIGLTIVALGTSAPEIIVSIIAALRNAGEMAVGNALGSNLANVGMVLGITALLIPLPMAKRLLKQELLLLLIVSAGITAILFDLELNLSDGIILLLTLVLSLWLLNRFNKDHDNDDDEIPELSINKAWFLFALGLGLLVGSSQLLVWGAKDIAQLMGVSELIIGLTIVAVGTSLPELAATLTSAFKGHHDIAIGNVIGSNLFNLLAVMAMPALIKGTELQADVFSRDYMSMLLMTAVMALFLLGSGLLRKQDENCYLGRLAGLTLLSGYIAYYFWLFESGVNLA